MRLFLALSIIFNISPSLQADELHDKIKSLIITGFTDENDGLALAAEKVGGLIFYTRNIVEKTALTSYIDKLRHLDEKLLFAVDQEGGTVRRLKPENGYTDLPSAKRMARQSDYIRELIYKSHFETVKKTGFNMILAPVVDIHQETCPVIEKLERAYAKDPQTVFDISRSMTKVFEKLNLLYAVKHFIGHGSSTNDSHEGITDITSTWQKKELLPFKRYADIKVPAIMTAHVTHKDWRGNDDRPFTLSPFLRKKMEELNFEGVIISDDLMMGALNDWVSKHHQELKEEQKIGQIAVEALRAGNHLLILSNNPFANKERKVYHTPTLLKEIVNYIYDQAKVDNILLTAIDTAHKKVMHLKEKL